MMTDRQKIFYQLGLFCATRKYWVLVLISLVTLIFSYFAFQIEIKPGIISLLDENDPEVMRIQHIRQNFGGSANVFMAVTADTLHDAKKYADSLADAMAGNDMVLRVMHTVDMDTFMKHGFLFLEKDEINEFRDFIEQHQQDLAEIFDDTHTAGFLNGFNHMIERQIIEKDDIGSAVKAMTLLDSFDDFLSAMAEAVAMGENSGDDNVKRSLRNLLVPGFSRNISVFEDGYMLSEDKRSVLLLVMPRDVAGDMVIINRFMDYLNKTAVSMAKGISGARFQIAGDVAVVQDEYAAILADARLSAVVTLFLVLIIFFVFFRKFSDLLMITVCLISGILWACGMTYFCIGFLGIITSFFSAMIIGLGIDFAVHLIARYSEYRNKGKHVEEALAMATAGSGPGILIGSATTASAFLVLMICRFKGISQLGLIAGMGILFVTMIMLTLLPSLIAIRDSRRSASRRQFHSMRTLPALSGLAASAVRHRRISIVLITFLTVVMVIAAFRIEFNYDFRSLEPRDSKAIRANHDVEKTFGRSVDYGLVLADSVEHSRELTMILKTRASVAEVHGISDYLPLNQSGKAGLIRQIEPFLAPVVIGKSPAPDERLSKEDIDELVFSLRESRRMFLAVKQIAILEGYPDIEEKCTKIMAHALALAEQIKTRWPADQFNIDYYQQVLSAELKRLLTNLKEASRAESLGVDQLPGIIRDYHIGRDGKFMLYVYPEGYIWTRDRLEQISADLRSVTKDSTSNGIVFMDLVNKIREDFRAAVWLSLLMVFIFVLAGFQRLWTAVIALVPLVLGSMWMVGTMVLLGLKFNLVNVAVIPFIIGIGIDDGVHLIHRYRNEPKDRIRTSVEHTGMAIFLTSITTMAGFGSLGLASYTAIATFGWVLLIGVFYCMVTSIIVLPVLLSIFEEWNIKI